MAQTCPPISFVNAPELVPSQAGNVLLLLPSPDGSYLEIEATSTSPYALVKAAPNIQAALGACFFSSTGSNRLAAATQNGAGSQTVAFAYLPSSGQALVAAPDADGQSADVVLLDIVHQSIVSQATYAAGSGSPSFLFADVNKDQILDLVVANSGSGVSILLGNGDGTFQNAVAYPAGNSPAAVAAGDFNHDGNPDIAVGNQGSKNISILLGNGDGTFQSASSYAASASTQSKPVSVTVADVNGDGNPDLLVPDGLANIGVLLGAGDGTFATASFYPAGIAPSYVAAADFHRSGRLDLAVASAAAGTVSILPGNGDGTFGASFSYAVAYPPVGLTVADINGDGVPDISTGFGTAALSVLFGRGDGTFFGAPIYSLSNLSPTSLSMADMNGDGVPDLVLAGTGSTYVAVLTGKGGGAFQPAMFIDAGNNGSGLTPSAAAIADFNGDGKPDLLVAGPFKIDGHSGRVGVMMGKGDGTFQALKMSIVNSDYPSAAVTADFNGDGKADAVIATSPINGDFPALFVLIGNGDGTFKTPVRLSGVTTPAALIAADVNGDQKVDLIVVDQGVYATDSPSTAGGIVVYLGKGDGTFQAPVTATAGFNPGTAAIGDLNSDGKPDLAVATTDANGNDALAVLLGKGDGTFSAATLLPSAASPAALAIADFNHDGKADLVVAHCCGNTDMTYLLGNGNGTFQSEQHFVGGPSPALIAAADLDGDGKPDLVVANQLAGGGNGGVTVLLSKVK